MAEVCWVRMFDRGLPVDTKIEGVFACKPAFVFAYFCAVALVASLYPRCFHTDSDLGQ